MSVDAELAAATEGRPGWRLDERGAVYARTGVTAHVRVRPVAALATARERFRAAIVGETAAYSTPFSTAVAAMRCVRADPTELSPGYPVGAPRRAAVGGRAPS